MPQEGDPEKTTQRSRLDWRDATSIPRKIAAPPADLPSAESLVLAKCDGKRPVADLASLLGFSTPETLMFVSRLIDLGLVELERQGEG